MTDPWMTDNERSERRNRPPRRWRDKFGEAFRGVALGIRGQSSFFVHFFFGVLAIATAALLKCDPIEWCLIITAIGLVMSLELVNSSIELLFRGLPQEARDRVAGSLDIAAGAVLMASLAAVIVGVIIFGPRMLGCLELRP